VEFRPWRVKVLDEQLRVVRRDIPEEGIGEGGLDLDGLSACNRDLRKGEKARPFFREIKACAIGCDRGVPEEGDFRLTIIANLNVVGDRG
jgi:hypothetical protein